MLFALFLVCASGLALSTLLLLLVGRRLQVAWPPLGVGFALLVAVASGQVAAVLWRLPTNLVEVGEGVVALASLGIVASRRDWNPVAQVFFGAFVASALVYL